MEKEMTGNDRRTMILSMMKHAKAPLPGSTLGSKTCVSRQVIVQDIALLRTEGHPIIATPRGYLLNEPAENIRLLKLCHTNEQTEDELTTIIDIGGCVIDVMVNHRVYGKMSAVLNIKNRRDIRHFINDIKEGKSTPLMNVTSGYHFHHIKAEQEAILDEIEDALRHKGYIAEMLPYEVE